MIIAGINSESATKPSPSSFVQERLRVFTCVYRWTPLINHFIRHYAALGFTDIHIASPPGVLVEHEYEYGPWTAIHPEPLYEGVFDNSRDTAVLNYLKARYIKDRNEWCAVADLDEFYEYPLELTKIIDFPPEYNCLEGWFVDRVAADGGLPNITSAQIEDQFPMRTKLTEKILKGFTRKAILMRGFQLFRRGHHAMDNEKVHPLKGRVHHYKWNSNVLAHIQERIDLTPQTGYQWSKESQRFLDYWKQNGRIVIEDVI